MIKYALRRLLMLIPLLLGVSFTTFVIAKLAPGDPVFAMLGPTAAPEKAAALREQLGLNDPLLIQYANFLWQALHGDLGVSYRGQTSVAREILARFPSTLQLTAAGMLLAALWGVSIGAISATTKNKWIERLTLMTALTGISLPSFWLAILLILIFGITLKWVSVTGEEGLRDLILPAFVVSISPGAMLARMTRTSIQNVLQEDFVRAARAKGLIERLVILRHVLPNALIPVVTLIGLQSSELLTGAVFIESVFARPGLGRLAITAISARDYPQIRGLVLFGALSYLIVNLAVDLLYGFLDPRIRYD